MREISVTAEIPAVALTVLLTMPGLGRRGVGLGCDPEGWRRHRRSARRPRCQSHAAPAKDRAAAVHSSQFEVRGGSQELSGGLTPKPSEVVVHSSVEQRAPNAQADRARDRRPTYQEGGAAAEVLAARR